MDKICEHCGETFRVKASRADRARYCQPACRKAHEAEHGRERSRKDGIEFACKNCGKNFSMMPGYLTQYHKIHGKDPSYCSSKCFGEASHAAAKERNTMVCAECGQTVTRITSVNEKTGYAKYDRKKRFCSVQCKAQNQRTKFKERFDAGNFTRRIKRGYVVVRIPGGNGRREMLEHRLVMERILGRPLLPEETVHHRSGDKTDNNPANLQLFCKNHGPGQAVEDAIAWAINMINRYPEFATEQGYVLTKIDS